MTAASSPDAATGLGAATRPDASQQVTFLIIGAGFSGLGAAIRLKQACRHRPGHPGARRGLGRDLARQYLPRLPL